jgi:acyl-CoA thioesterase
VSYAFDVDTRVEPRAGGGLGATITDRWNAVGERPNGGYLLGICLQALRRVLPFPDPLTVAAFFLRPARPGPAEVRTEVVRAGRRLATGEARLLQEGAEVVRAVATFTELGAASGRALVLAEPPDLPAPDEAVDVVGGRSLPGLSLVDRFEYRMAGRPGWTQGRPSGDPCVQLWLRFRDGRDADPLSLPAIVDAAFPAVMEIGAPGSSTLELTAHVRARPAPGWLACRVSTRDVIDGYHEEDFEVWDSRGALVAQSRQLALLPAP